MVAQIIKKQIERIEYREKNMFWIFFFVLIFFLISYGFMVNKTIANAVAKQQMEVQITSLNSDVNSIESGYLNLKNSITMELALSNGFIVNLGEKYAVAQPNSGLSLSVNEN